MILLVGTKLKSYKTKKIKVQSSIFKTKGEVNMAFEMKDNTGSLFPNDKKETDSQPDKRGTFIVDGKPYWVSAWDNVAASGIPYQALKFKLKEEYNPKSPQKEPARGGGFSTMKDDVPF
jgi:hypothetical protein